MRGALRRVLLAGVLIAAGLTSVIAAPTPASAALQGMPAGFVDELVAGGLPFPTAITFASDDTMFIALKSGIVRVYRNGQVLPTPFVDISNIVHDNADRGLLGITLHPSFPTQPYVYLLYTYDPPGTAPDGGAVSKPARTAQLMRIEADPATAFATAKTTPGSQVVLLGAAGTRAAIGNENDGGNAAFASCMNPKTPSGTPVEDCIPSDEDSHTIGSVAFAPDGSLFLTSGDGSNYGSVDPRALRAQHLDSLSGKVLRIDPITGAGLPDNPFFDPAKPNSNRSKVWARGLRNPFRFTINPVNGDPYVGDVGWNSWEEINTGKGANFGWPCYEGATANGVPEGGTTVSAQQSGYASSSSTSAQCGALYSQGAAAVKAPVYTYDHSTGGAATSGGAFYTGATYPAQYQGAMFIADFNNRWIRYLTFDAQGRATKTNFATDPTSGPVQLITGPDTNIYWMRYDDTGGEVRRIRYVGAGNVPPVAEATATPRIGLAPLNVVFNSDESYDADAQPLSFSWNFGDGTSSTQRNPTHTYTQSGVYDARLTLTELTAPFATSETTQRIVVGNDPPLVTIEQPFVGTTFRIGDTIAYSATATAGGTPIPAETMTWQLQQHHNDHVHFSTLTSAADPADPNRSRGSVNLLEHGDGVFYDLCVTATIAPQVSDNQCVAVLPQETEYTLLSQPPGLQLVYEDEGISVATPALIHPTVGSQQTVIALPVQQHLSFVRWSDGLTDRFRSFTVGTTPQTFTAVYENQPPTAVISPPAPLGQAPYTVTLNAGGSSDPEGDVLTYAWSTSDGQTDSTAQPTFTFPTVGNRTVTLTVTDQLGATGTTQVIVQATQNQNPPVASFTADPTSGRTPLTVTLDGRSSFDPEGGPLTHAWSSSDGQATSGAQASLTFNQAGSYTITLTVTDAAGTTGTASRVVDVQPSALVGAWGFNEVSGPSVGDASGLGNVGSVSGASRTAAGKVGGALSFDGVNDFVSIPDAASLDLTNNMTLSAWVQPSTVTDWRTVLMKEVPGGLAYALDSSGDVPQPSGTVRVGVVDQAVVGPTALPLNVWRHLALTYDGATMRLYVDGVQVATRAQTGSAPVSASPLKIGGNAAWGEYFAGLIDEVHVYNRALTAGEVSTDMGTGVVQDLTVPVVAVTAPVSGATVSGSVNVAASASDNVGVAGVQFRVDGANVGVEDTSSPYGVAWNSALVGNGSHVITAVARDAAGNTATSATVTVTVSNVVDGVPPAVAVTAPVSGATVSGSVNVAASASDNVGVAGVQFRVDGANVGVEDTSSPYGVAWNSALVGNGSHVITAVARDAAGNTATSATVTVTVANAAPSGLVGAWGFNEVSGPSVGDASGLGNVGSVSGASRTAAGKVGGALSFDGVNDFVSIPDAASLDLTNNMTLSAWVQPSTVTDWRTVLMKEVPGGLAYALDSSGDVPQPSGTVRVGVVDQAVVGPTALPLNVWRHLALTYDGATMRLYVDGVQVATRAQTGSAPVSASPLKIGGNAAWGEYFAGLIDEVHVYNRALTAGEVSTDMGTGVVQDLTVPVVAVTAPVSGATVSGSVNVAASASDNVGVAGVQFRVDGANVGVEDTSSPYGVAWNSALVGNGSHVITAVARDAAGNTATSATVTVTVSNVVDGVPPAVAVTAPVSGATVSGSVNVAASASDNVGVAGVQFRVDGANVGVEDTSSPYGVAWNSALVGNGSHVITAVARDAAGNTATSATVTVTVNNVDGVLPVVAVTAPVSGATVSGSVNVAASASDNVGVAGVQFRVDGANVGVEDTSSPYGVAWNSALVGNGSHVITAVARDAAGNTATSATVTVTVNNDVTVPVVAVTAPVSGATVSGSVNVAASASDNVGVAGVQFRVDGANVGVEDTSSPYGVAWNSALVGNGSHVITAVARDAAGNTATSATVTVTVANAAPSGLVGAWGFNEVSGPSVGDASGLGNVGSVSGASRTAAGKVGGALSFDGVNDFVSIPDAASLDLTNNMTLSAWVQPSTVTDWRTVLMKEVPGGLAYALDSSGDVPQPSGTVRVGVVDQAVVGPTALPLNVWRHLALTYDGARMRLYVDGVQVATRAQTGSAPVSASPLKIGGNAAWGEYFAGLIDEVHVYNRALTAAQVATDMATAL